MCTVEVQFASDPKDQVNLVGDSETCIGDGSPNCYIPPELVLEKEGITKGKRGCLNKLKCVYREIPK